MEVWRRVTAAFAPLAPARLPEPLAPALPQLPALQYHPTGRVSAELSSLAAGSRLMFHLTSFVLYGTVASLPRHSTLRALIYWPATSNISHTAGESTQWDPPQPHDPVHFLQPLLETGKKILTRFGKVKKHFLCFFHFACRTWYLMSEDVWILQTNKYCHVRGGVYFAMQPFCSVSSPFLCSPTYWGFLTVSL